MPISTSTLTALQKAGTAIFHADEKLKSEVAAYAQRANAAVLNNPYSLGNAALIESWQVTARLSKKLSGIEEELRELYRIAGELTEEDLPIVRETRALSAPASVPTSTGTKKAAKKTVAKAVDLSATTVKVKKATRKQTAKTTKASTAAPTPKAATPLAKGKKTAAPSAKSTKSAKPTKPASKASVTKATQAVAKGTQVKASKEAGATPALQGNPAKLLSHLSKVLNTDKFEHINQTALAKSTGIPLGSMTAAITRLVNAGQLVAGSQGSYKLAKVTVKAAQKRPAKAKASVAAPAKTPTPASTTAPASTATPATAPATTPAPTTAQPDVKAIAATEAQS